MNGGVLAVAARIIRRLHRDIIGNTASTLIEP
jgi:hypothetical protein